MTLFTGRRRPARSVGVALLLSLTLAGQVLAAVAWSVPAVVGGNYSWNSGYALARTGASPDYLHAVYATDHVNGAWVSDAGPYQGIYYVRSSDGATSWSAPRRVNSPAQHGRSPVVAGSGPYVYVAWETFGSYDNFDPAASRALRIRANTDFGASTSWLAPVAVFAGWADYATLAAASGRAYIAWGDRATGEIKLATYLPGSLSVATQVVGSTTNLQNGDHLGFPAVAAAGRNVAVAWISDSAGALKARISTDRGVHWGPAVALVSDGARAPYAHANGDRIAIAWTRSSGVRVRIWQAGAWQPSRAVYSFASTQRYKNGSSAAVALVGTGGVGVAWSACWLSSCDAAVDLLWRESSDNGATWREPAVLAVGPGQPQYANAWPSIVWDGAAKRYVLFNRVSILSAMYRIWLTEGTGTP